MLIKFVSDGFKFGESKILISNQGQTLYFNFSSIGAILMIQEEKFFTLRRVTGFLFFSSKILIQKSNPAADSHQMTFYIFNRDISINSNLTGNVININVSNRK